MSSAASSCWPCCSLLGAAVYHHAYLEPFAAIAGRTASALAASIATR